MSKTKEEKFLIKLHEMNDNQDFYEVGHAIGLNDSSIKNIVRILQQSNFIKKIDDNKVCLTSNGQSLVNTLING